MSDYTPTTDDLRDIWVDRQLDHLPTEEGIRRVPETQAAFDRWLASVKAQALTDVADQMRDRFTASWIRGKAREYTHGPHKIVGAFAISESNQEEENK